MDTQILARIYALVAEMEALKIDALVILAEEADLKYAVEIADKIRGIVSELQQLGHL